jgi:hypothetical protein
MKHHRHSRRTIDPTNPPGPKRKPVPFAGQKLGEFLISDPSYKPAPRPCVFLLVGDVRIAIAIDGDHLVVDAPDSVQVAARPDVETADRKARVDAAWWRPTVDAERFALVAECAQCHCYQFRFSTNQRIDSTGDLEEIITRGILAWHAARGKKPPVDGIALENDDP